MENNNCECAMYKQYMKENAELGAHFRRQAEKIKAGEPTDLQLAMRSGRSLSSNTFWNQNDSLHFAFGIEGRIWFEPSTPSGPAMFMAVCVTDIISGGLQENTNRPVGFHTQAGALIFKHVSTIKGLLLFELAQCYPALDLELDQSIYWLDGAPHA